VGVVALVRDYVEALLHPSAQTDALTALRHRAFIAPRLLFSVIAMALFPAYLLVRGAPSTVELVAFAWLVVPILTAYFLSRTGRYQSAHLLSSLALTGLVTMVAASTGGIASFAAIWLAVVPLEAALSASRRIVATASIFALGAAGLLMTLGAFGWLPPLAISGGPALTALGIVSAALYATGLALGAEALARTGVRLLYAEEDRYRLLAQNMSDVVARFGTDGSMQFVSPAAETLFGCALSELRGHGLFERVHVIDRPAYLTALGDAGTLAEARSVEFRVRRDALDDAGRAAVEFIWIEMRCRPLDRPGGAVGGHTACGIVAVLRDVTARKVQERTLEQARAETERANAAKSRFLATMSHELRTPLNAVIGFSDMLMKEDTLRLDAVRRHEYAQLIHESGRHLLAIVNGILDMSKIETGNFDITPEPFAPSRVVEGCCELMALRAQEAGVTLERRGTERLPEMIADRRALNQILLNLISNAIRFSDRGGKVVVSTRAGAGHITFVVEDDGVGIGEEDLRRVGEPYFQAHSSYDRRHSGTGLGLSIVKGLVRLHGGDMTIRSRLGEGTRVSVQLPVNCECRAVSGEPPATLVVDVASHLLPQRNSGAAANELAERVVLRQPGRIELSGLQENNKTLRVKKSA
jgi:cell cycle sensor histidine kinase DivJ